MGQEEVTPWLAFNRVSHQQLALAGVPWARGPMYLWNLPGPPVLLLTEGGTCCSYKNTAGRGGLAARQPSGDPGIRNKKGCHMCPTTQG